MARPAWRARLEAAWPALAAPLLLLPLRRAPAHLQRLFPEPLGAGSFREYAVNTAGLAGASAALATPLFGAASQMVRRAGGAAGRRAARGCWVALALLCRAH